MRTAVKLLVKTIMPVDGSML